jgi:hypothetical protein
MTNESKLYEQKLEKDGKITCRSVEEMLQCFQEIATDLKETGKNLTRLSRSGEGK